MMQPTVTVEDLVDDVIVKIFSYLRLKDIVHHVRRVCVRWEELSQDCRVWQHITYTPTADESEADIADTLLQAPKLRYLVLEDRYAGFNTENALLKSGSELRKLVFRYDQKFRHQYFQKLFLVTSKLEHLVLPMRLKYSPEECELIGKLNNLKVLKMCSVTGNCPELPLNLKPVIEGCPLLEHIDLGKYFCNFDDLEKLLLAKKDKLHSLGLRCGSRDGKCNLSLLSSGFSLKTLKVNNYCDYGCAEDFKYIYKFKNLEELGFDYMEVINLDLVYDLFSDFNLCLLTKVSISCYNNYHDVLAEVIILNCPRIKSLSLSYCYYMTNESFKWLGTLKNLESLHILSSSLTDGVMDYIVPCRHLKVLHLQACEYFTSVSLKRIVEFRELEVLKLTLGCNLEGLPYHLFPSKLKKLKLLSVFCSMIKNRAGLKKLKKQMPHLVILD